MAPDTNGCWNHYIQTELNPPAAGSQLFGELLTIDIVNVRLNSFKLVEVVPVVPASPWP